MPKATITKEALADAIKNIMKEKALRAISVKDITEYCTISRNTFYYHFSDKYDLINWIFYSETLPVVNTFSDPERWLDGFVNLCKYMHAERSFYRSALEYMGQNSLRDYLIKFYCELLEIHIDTIYNEHGYKLDPSDLSLIARFQAHAYVGIIMDWVEAGMHANYMNYFEQLKRVKQLKFTPFFL